MADFTITGTLSPDATGDYTQGADYDGAATYSNGTYVLWTGALGLKILSSAAGTYGDYWQKSAGDTSGDYAPQGSASGTATVAVYSGAPIAVTEATLTNTSPYDQDEVIGTVEATGGTSPYTWTIVSQTLVE